MSPKLKFSKCDFQEFNLPNLLLNIWGYADARAKKCNVCKQYEIRFVEAAQEKWKPQYLDFEYVIKNLRHQIKQFYKFCRISSTDRNVIYKLISSE